MDQIVKIVVQSLLSSKGNLIYQVSLMNTEGHRWIYQSNTQEGAQKYLEFNGWKRKGIPIIYLSKENPPKSIDSGGQT